MLKLISKFFNLKEKTLYYEYRYLKLKKNLNQMNMPISYKKNDLKIIKKLKYSMFA